MNKNYCNKCNYKRILVETNEGFLCESCFKKYKHKKEKKLLFDEYYQNLIKNCQSDEFDGILKNLPLFYELSCEILVDDSTNWMSKFYLQASLAYLCIENDVYDDKEGAKGLIDDLFILTYSLKKIRDQESVTILTKCLKKLEFEINIEDYLTRIYEVNSKCIEFINYKDREKILNTVGLIEFEKEIQPKHKSSINQSDFIKKRKEKTLKLLYAMVAVKLLDYIRKGEIESTRLDSLILSEYDEIMRYINLLK